MKRKLTPGELSKYAKSIVGKTIYFESDIQESSVLPKNIFSKVAFSSMSVFEHPNSVALRTGDGLYVEVQEVEGAVIKKRKYIEDLYINFKDLQAHKTIHLIVI